jgi:ABC-type phosphate transport system substrate-binding protein
MRPVTTTSLATSAGAFAAVALSAGGARAMDCTTLSNPVYVIGSTAIGPVVASISAYLAVSNPPVTVVYGGTGSCVGVNDAISNVPITTPAGMNNYFKYYDATGTAQTCDITAPDGGTPVYGALALSDVYATSCPASGATPANAAGYVKLPVSGLAGLGITESLGPVQAMTFAVPFKSDENSISGEAAYMVFGFGNNSGVSPWIAASHMYQRGPTSGTQAMIAAAIGVPSVRWYGNTPAGTAGMIAALTTANAASDDQAIGILGAADVDPLRRAGSPPIKELAYQHVGQNCGYLPDSAVGFYDKLNVRNGHYDIWGPLHILQLPVTGSTAQASQVVHLLTGATQTGTLDVIASEAAAGLVPQCAMRVSRAQEVGPMTPVNPTTSQIAPCGCYFEYVASPSHTLTTSTCTPCMTTAECPVAGSQCPQFTSNGSTLGWCEAP